MSEVGNRQHRRDSADAEALEHLIPAAELLPDAVPRGEPHFDLDLDLGAECDDAAPALRPPRLQPDPAPDELAALGVPTADDLADAPTPFSTEAPHQAATPTSTSTSTSTPAPLAAEPEPDTASTALSARADEAEGAPPPTGRPLPSSAAEPPARADAAAVGGDDTRPPAASAPTSVAPALATDAGAVPPGVHGNAGADSPEAEIVARLRAQGKLSDGDMARARKLAEDGGEALRSMLVRLGLVSDRDMAAAYATVLDLPLIAAADYPDTPVADLDLSLRFLKDTRMVPLRGDADALEMAVADPVDASAVRAVEMAVGRPLRLRVGLPTEIDAALERLYEAPEAEQSDTDLAADIGNFSEEDIEHLRDLASEAPIIRLVNQIMQRAVESRASDVHIEPFADELKVRYRIDGILKESESPPVRSTAAVISRIKIMAKLNIAERRLPQDGRIPLRIQGKELDLRVSTVPTMFGESVVMRLLDKESVRFDFDALGFDGPPRERVLQILQQPYGVFLVTGPTGSGKSTTLYTALARLNTEHRKIITVEDPVEYQVPGINQIPVKASIGMTFAHALRAIVRQDPDIIMVGEMRDLETARIAVQSALTGHVVLSTLHTNDAASGITRLLDMGVEDYLLTSTINGILAQRLVRRLCPECRQPFRPLPEMAARFLQLPGVDENALTLYLPRGCDACKGTGYRGRLVIAEVLLMTDRIRQAVLAHATATELGRIAVEQDMLTMYQDGLRKAAAGHTTVEEVMRVAAVADDEGA
jgi:general secretion pathway protein E